MHTIKSLLTYYLSISISVYMRQIYQIAESNRIETFFPELECSTLYYQPPASTRPGNGIRLGGGSYRTELIHRVAVT